MEGESPQIPLDRCAKIQHYLVMSSPIKRRPLSKRAPLHSPLAASESEPKHAAISRLITRQIMKGARLPGSKLPTESQLMSEFGVSRITIRRVLQDLSRDGLIVGKQGKGSYVNESEAALALNVLFVHAAETNLSHPYTAGILEGILTYGERQIPPFRVELCPMPAAHLQSAEDTTIEERVTFGRIKGILALPRIHPAALQRLQAAGVPIVIIGGHGPLELPGGTVVVDSERTRPPYEAGIRHLLGLGRRKIGLIGPHSHSISSIVENITRMGIDFSPSQYEAGNWGINGGAEAMERLLNRHPDINAIHASEDLMALGAMHVIWKRGLSVPGDVAIIGVGNFLGESSHADLSSVDLHLPKQGELAGALLTRILEGLPVKPENVIRPTLIQRGSTTL